MRAKLVLRKSLPELSWRHDFKSCNHADHLHLLISGDDHIYSTTNGSRQDATVVFSYNVLQKRRPVKCRFIKLLQGSGRIHAGFMRHILWTLLRKGLLSNDKMRCVMTFNPLRAKLVP